MKRMQQTIFLLVLAVMSKIQEVVIRLKSYKKNNKNKTNLLQQILIIKAQQKKNKKFGMLAKQKTGQKGDVRDQDKKVKIQIQIYKKIQLWQLAKTQDNLVLIDGKKILVETETSRRETEIEDAVLIEIIEIHENPIKEIGSITTIDVVPLASSNLH